MLLKELFAKDIDLSEYDKKIMVNIKQEGTLNIKTLYVAETNSANLKSSKDMLVKYKFIEETDQKDFYKVTDTGIESMKRAALLDDSGEFIDSNSKKYFYN